MSARTKNRRLSERPSQHTTHGMAACGQAVLYMVFLWVLCASPMMVRAELAINKAIVPFDSPFERSKDIEVINTSTTEILYVDVEVMAVINPGETQGLRSTRGSVDPGLVATPAKLAVPPGSRQVVRIMNLKPVDDVERVYRINFTPMLRPLSAESGLQGETTQTMVQIVVAYQALVLIPLAEPEAIVDYKRHGQTVVFANTGNANVLLRRGKQCDPSDSSVCVELTSRRVYPGRAVEFEVPYEGPLFFTLQSLRKIEQREFL